MQQRVYIPKGKYRTELKKVKKLEFTQYMSMLQDKNVGSSGSLTSFSFLTCGEESRHCFGFSARARQSHDCQDCVISRKGD